MPSFLGAKAANLDWLRFVGGTSWRWPLLFAGIWLLHTTTLAVYRLTWHPLAKFPGPVLARASYMYEFWFDVILEGRYTRRIQELHRKYGPIVRVNPDEIHCNDPAFIDVVYPTGKEKRNKSKHYLAAVPPGLRLATVGTEDHDHHRLRRGSYVNFFSRSQVMKSEQLFRDKAQRLCDKLLEYREHGPFLVDSAYSCFTTDTLTEYSFGQSLGNLETPGWHPSFKGTIDEVTSLFYLTRHINVLARLVDIVPLSLCRLLSTEISSLLELIRITVPRLVEGAKDTNRVHVDDKSSTVIQVMLDSDLPEAEKSTERITSEAVALVLGGTHPVSTVLSIATFHLLSEPARLERLRLELRAAIPDETDLPSWAALEKLPYLNSVVMESVRLVFGVASRVSVVASDELLYTPSDKALGASANVEDCYVIPAGSAIGVSSYMTHTNPTVFSNGDDFVPERWLDDNGQRERGLEKYLMSFSRGHRQCVGMHLAYCELYIATAALALRVWPKMRLYDTTIADIAYDHDQLLSMPKKGTKGVRAVML